MKTPLKAVKLLQSYSQLKTFKFPAKCMELTIYGQTLGVFKLQLIKRNSKETKRTMHKSKFVVF